MIFEKLLHSLTRLHTFPLTSKGANTCSLAFMDIISLHKHQIPKGCRYLSTVQCTALDATSPPDSAAGFDTCLTLHSLSLVATGIHQDAHVPILTGAFLTKSELNLITSLLPKLD